MSFDVPVIDLGRENETHLALRPGSDLPLAIRANVRKRLRDVASLLRRRAAPVRPRSPPDSPPDRPPPSVATPWTHPSITCMWLDRLEEDFDEPRRDCWEEECGRVSFTLRKRTPYVDDVAADFARRHRLHGFFTYRFYEAPVGVRAGTWRPCDSPCVMLVVPGLALPYLEVRGRGDLRGAFHFAEGAEYREASNPSPRRPLRSLIVCFAP